jgi:hypothetical protein
MGSLLRLRWLRLARSFRLVKASDGIRMAFETRTCASFPWAQILYTLDVETPSRAATSRTVSRRSSGTVSALRDCGDRVAGA